MDILAVILLNVLALPIQELLSELFGVPQLPALWLIFIVSVVYWIVKYRKKFLTKKTWTSDIWIVEVSEKLLIYLWVVYFIIQAMKGSELFANLLAVVSEWTSWINLSLFPRPIAFLLGLTLIFSVLSLCYHKRIKKKIYEKLDKDEFPEYDFSFQSNLVDFLNSDNQFGQNIYWLDGAWGTGKTYFIRTFFERQKYKVREIYYISCFGIKTRSQAEQVLLSEIEARSRLGIFSNIPVIGSLISWGFNASGLGLMKKDAILIFDDLERVVYNAQVSDIPPVEYNEMTEVPIINNGEGTDEPVNYNDLLGFIDYLANHKNQKVIIVYNSSEIKNTHKHIIEKKFSMLENRIPSVENVIEEIIKRKEGSFDDSGEYAVIFKFFEKVFKLMYSGLGESNFRELNHMFERYRDNSNISKSKLELFLIEDMSEYLNKVASIPEIRIVMHELLGSGDLLSVAGLPESYEINIIHTPYRQRYPKILEYWEDYLEIVSLAFDVVYVYFGHFDSLSFSVNEKGEISHIFSETFELTDNS